MSSGIIASNVPEDGESVIIDADNTNLMRLTRSRMERRLLSLPDQNAVTRLSQTSMNKDMDFSSNDGHSTSAFSANMEASDAAMRRSCNEGNHKAQLKDFDPVVFLRSQGLDPTQFGGFLSSTRPGSQSNLPLHSHSHSSPQNVQFHGDYNNFTPAQHPVSNSTISGQPEYHLFTSIQKQPPPPIGHAHAPQDMSMLAPSLQVAAQVFNTNALAAQSLAQTAQVALSLFHESQTKSSTAPRSTIGSLDSSQGMNNND